MGNHHLSFLGYHLISWLICPWFNTQSQFLRSLRSSGAVMCCAQLRSQFVKDDEKQLVVVVYSTPSLGQSFPGSINQGTGTLLCTATRYSGRWMVRHREQLYKAFSRELHVRKRARYGTIDTTGCSLFCPSSFYSLSLKKRKLKLPQLPPVIELEFEHDLKKKEKHASWPARPWSSWCKTVIHPIHAFSTKLTSPSENSKHEIVHIRIFYALS